MRKKISSTHQPKIGINSHTMTIIFKRKKQGITPITQKWGRMDFKTPEVYQRTLSTLYHH